MIATVSSCKIAANCITVSKIGSGDCGDPGMPRYEDPVRTAEWEYRKANPIDYDMIEPKFLRGLPLPPGNVCAYCRRTHNREECPGCGAPG